MPQTRRRSKSRSDNPPPSITNGIGIPAEQYIKNCEQFDLNVDPSVVIALKTNWPVLQPSKQFGQGAMLPLMGILEQNNHVVKLNLSSTSMQDSRYRASGNGNSNARALSSILRMNYTIKELDLSDTGLDDDGIAEICTIIKSNKSVEILNLSYNTFGELGAKLLKEALIENNTLKKLDLSRNALGYQSINSLLCSCISNNLEIATNGNYVFEEILNSVSHGVAFLVSIIGAFLLISTAIERGTDYHFWACAIYSFSLMFLFLSSSLFHSFFMLPKTSRVLQILDHVGIYMVIAGTYTPYLLIALHHDISGQVLLTGEWIAAFSGIIFAACTDLNAKSSTIVELCFFLGMGFGLLLVWPAMIANLTTTDLSLLLGGGAAYVIGIIFFILGEIKPIYHVIWHMFVILGAALHWFDIYFFIVPKSLHLPTGLIFEP